MATADRSPPLLRLVYLTLFLGLCAVGVELAFPELLELIDSLRAPFRFGEPPNLFAVVSACALPVLAVLVLVYAARGRAPRWLSGAVLVVFGVAVLASHESPEARSPFEADRRILRAAEALHLTMNEILQKQGEISDQAGDWQERLSGYNDRPVRRGLSAQPLSVELLPADGALPLPTPGRIYVQVSGDRASYTLHPAGFDAQGRPAYLSDPHGEPVVLKGLFNPNRRAGGL